MMVVEVWGGKTEIVVCEFGLPYDLLFPAQEVLGGELKPSFDAAPYLYI